MSWRLFSIYKFITFFEDIHSELVDTIFSNMMTNSFLLERGNDEYQTVNKSSRPQ